MRTTMKLGMSAVALAVIAACSTLPDRVDTLEQARLSVRTVERDELAAETGSTEIEKAHSALAEADEAYRDKKSLELITHKAYVAQRYADIAKERIAEGRAKQDIARAETQRNEVVLQARTREAEAAERQANAAQ